MTRATGTAPGPAERLARGLTGAGDSAEDLSPEARAAEPANVLRHMGALSMTKVADGLINPKLVLASLLAHLGAPAVFVGLLVPIREAGALLPQLFIAGRIEAMPRRKWAWAVGSFGQGMAAAGIALAALALEGWAAGAAIAALLALLAVARSVCSTSYKDVLGRTVGKTRRGAVTGLASSVAAAAVVVFALALIAGPGDRPALVTGAVALAAGLWIAAALLFTTLAEDADRGRDRRASPIDTLALLRDDAGLRRFVAARGLLTSTALAPPFLVLLDDSGGLDRLGILVLVSSVAAFLSAYVWGRLADRSSRRVLIAAGALGALALGAAVALALAGDGAAGWAVPLCLFVLMLAYHGVRQARSTWLVDYAPDDRRAGYTAAANTVIGLALLGSGLAGALASVAGPGATLALFAVMAGAGALVALGLDEVEVYADGRGA